MAQKNILSRYSVVFLLFSNILVLASNWSFAVWRFRISENFIPIHYTIYFGFDRFGPKFDIFLFPTLGAFIFIVNILIYKRLFADNALWKGIFIGLTFLFELILFFALVLSVLKSVS